MANITGYLNTIKAAERGEEVRDAIINCLNAINKDNPSTIKPLNVTSNGTYVGENGIVYNPVTVNVPEGAASALTLKDVEITENGETVAGDGEAYRFITVNVPQYTNDILEEVTFTSNGEYTALKDGYDGYGKVVVNVQTGGSGTYTVKFMAADRTTVLQTVINVPYGGGCIYSGATPTSTGMRFVGWTPNPTYITADTNCYPRFEDPIVDDTLITDDWVTIAKKVRQDPDAYNIGQWKLLDYGASQDPSFIGTAESPYVYPAGIVKMRLVAKNADILEGNNGYAPTTWVAQTVLYNNIFFTPRKKNWPRWYTDGGGGMQWSRSYLWWFLNSHFVNEAFPQDLKPYLRNVVKHTREYLDGVIYNNNTSINAIWIPSARELNFGNCELSDPDDIEEMGPVYDAWFDGGLNTSDSFNKRYDFRALTGLSTSTYPMSIRSWKGYGIYNIWQNYGIYISPYSNMYPDTTTGTTISNIRIDSDSENVPLFGTIIGFCL